MRAKAMSARPTSKLFAVTAIKGAIRGSAPCPMWLLLRSCAGGAYGGIGGRYKLLVGSSIVRAMPTEPLVCAECGRRDPGAEPGWTLRLDVNDEPVAFCPDCDRKEFGDD